MNIDDAQRLIRHHRDRISTAFALRDYPWHVSMGHRWLVVDGCDDYPNTGNIDGVYAMFHHIATTNERAVAAIAHNIHKTLVEIGYKTNFMGLTIERDPCCEHGQHVSIKVDLQDIR